MKKIESSAKRIIAVVCSMVLIVTMFAITGVLNTSAAEFSETNPTLELAAIQGDPEGYKSVALYDHESDLSQDGTTYTIDTNSYVAWFPTDDVAFAYKYYGVASSGDDYLEATVKADYFTNTDGTTFDLSQGAHHPSTGLMFRSGLGNDAGFIFVHVRDAGQVVVVYRDPSFEYLYQCTNQNGKDYTAADYPLQFKMKLKAGVVQIEYKGANASTWTKFNPVAIPSFRKGIYAGVAAHSGSEAQTLRATFTELNITGIASLDESGGSTGGNSSVVEEPVTPDEELPNSGNILLRETFTDGTLTAASSSKTNPIWSRFSEGTAEIKNINGNRVLKAEFGDDWDVVGKATWTDYSASMDMSFTEENAESDYSAIGLIVRHVGNVFFGYQNYMVVVQNGYKICIYENFLQTKVVLNTANIMKTFNLREIFEDDEYSVLGDGKVHNLKVDCLDNTLTIYFDDQKVGTFTDDCERTKSGNGCDVFAVNAVGQVGVIFKNVFGYVDNIVVRDIVDNLGGDYDNKICGNWDQEIPDYIAAYGES